MKVATSEIVDIEDIIEAEYNPRKMRPSAFSKLKDSLSRFGLVDPLIVNNRDKRMVLVGGHQRLRAAKDLGFEKVPVTFVDLDDEDEKALNIALNNAEIAGDWDTPKLAELLRDISPERRAATGFDEHQVAQFLERLRGTADEPVYPLTPKLLEHYDYVVIFTTHETDWMNLKSVFGLSTEQSYKKQKIGTGRVVSFERFLDVLEAHGGKRPPPPEPEEAAKDA